MTKLTHEEALRLECVRLASTTADCRNKTIDLFTAARMIETYIRTGDPEAVAEAAAEPATVDDPDIHTGNFALVRGMVVGIDLNTPRRFLVRFGSGRQMAEFWADPVDIRLDDERD